MGPWPVFHLKTSILKSSDPFSDSNFPDEISYIENIAELCEFKFSDPFLCDLFLFNTMCVGNDVYKDTFKNFSFTFQDSRTASRIASCFHGVL